MADIKNKINIDDIYGVTAKVGPVDIRAEQKVKNLKPEGQPTFSVGTGFYEEGVPVDIGLNRTITKVLLSRLEVKNLL